LLKLSYIVIFFSGRSKEAGVVDLYIFAKNEHDYQVDSLTEKAEKLAVSCQVIVYRYLNLYLNNYLKISYKGEKLDPPQSAIFRSAGHGEVGSHYVPFRQMLISEWQNKVNILNQQTYLRYIRLDKLTQHHQLFKAGLPVIKTYYFTSEDAFSADKIRFPVIVKNKFGSCGRNVFKAESKQELKNILKSQGVVNCLIQPFLTTGCDYRVIVIGGRAIGAMKKTAADGQFLTNFSQGGKVEHVELNKELRGWAEGAAKTFDCGYCGIDIMYDESGQGYILEVNRACQFKGFEQSNGIDVAQKTLDYLLNRLE